MIIKDCKNLFNKKELEVLVKIMKEQVSLETQKDQIKLVKEILSEIENNNINQGTVDYLDGFLGFDIEVFEEEDKPVLKGILNKIKGK